MAVTKDECLDRFDFADADCSYPAESMLETIKQFPIETMIDCYTLLDEIRPYWKYEN